MTGEEVPPMTSEDAPAPQVGVVMGSDSDWDTLRAAVVICDRFGVPSEVRVTSAHRTPAKMLDYAGQAAGRGLKVLIAGAGGAAHLPGMLASATRLPVIGVPVALRHLDGIDSLLSIVQMPRGVPVATVAVDNASNAGLLAVRMLALGDDDLAEALEAHRDELAERSREADERVMQQHQDSEGIGFR
jgi:5-(carboxyamino)imidazole ribonucleotide mutase